MFILELVTIYMNEIYTLEGKGADHWLKPIQYGGHHAHIITRHYARVQQVSRCLKHQLQGYAQLT